MRPSFQSARLWWLVILLVIAFAGLGYRLVDLQVVQHLKLKKDAQGNTRRAFYIPPHRGDIRDSRGNLLATSKLVKTVCADPTLICNDHVGNRQREVARALAPCLQMPEAELIRLLQLRTVTNESGKVTLDQYVVLKRKVSMDDWAVATNTMSHLTFGLEERSIPKPIQPYYKGLRQRAISGEDEEMRVYPNNSRAAHVLGFVGPKKQATNSPDTHATARFTRPATADEPTGPEPPAATPSLARWPAAPSTTASNPSLTIKTNDREFALRPLSETSGKDGVEMTMDSELRGVAGWRFTELDERRRELVTFRDQDVPPRPGLNVVLTLDLGLQEIIETELADAMQKHTPISASAIVMRPQTGEVLAMATLPNYDPNNPAAAPLDSRRNRVITDLAEPGSTFKIVVVTAALNEKLVDLNDFFDCEQGHFVYAGRVLRDHERYGVLSVEQIITKSSNIGAAKIGIKLGPARLHQYIRDFGFGERSRIPLPGEMFGIVYSLPNWTKLSITRIPMGHEIAVTPLQMAMAMGALANGGKLMRPMLVSRLADDQGRVVAQYQPEIVRRVCGEAAARQMVAALKTVVSTNGTAHKAQLDNYFVAGKTGTAQKAGKGGYLPGKFFSSFIGFFPADRPELCISVVLDEPKHGYYGGQTAAPYFHNIAERAANYLSIRPDSLPVEMIASPGRTNRLTSAKAR